MAQMRVLYIEPFHAGSHRAFGQALTAASWADWNVLTLPGRHWKWRMRGSAAYLARAHAETLTAPVDLVFASAYLPLAELIGLCPQLAARPRVLYFHENQLAYPQRGGAVERERDLHYGFTQLVSALAATRCVFNSEHNRTSFLTAAASLLARMPDAVAPDWVADISARSEVLGLPLELPAIAPATLGEDPSVDREDGPLIVWNHRWEHDKGPADLVALIDGLIVRQLRFRLAVCGREFRRRPPELAAAEPRWRAQLGPRLVQFGELDRREDYLALLGRAQLVLSTAAHEFFGVSVVEAVHCGARPLVPDALSYPELLPAEFRYRDLDDALASLARCCELWTAGALDLRRDRRALSEAHASAVVLPRYRELFERLINAG